MRKKKPYLQRVLSVHPEWLSADCLIPAPELDLAIETRLPQVEQDRVYWVYLRTCCATLPRFGLRKTRLFFPYSEIEYSRCVHYTPGEVWRKLRGTKRRRDQDIGAQKTMGSPWQRYVKETMEPFGRFERL